MDHLDNFITAPYHINIYLVTYNTKMSRIVTPSNWVLGLGEYVGLHSL